MRDPEDQSPSQAKAQYKRRAKAHHAFHDQIPNQAHSQTKPKQTSPLTSKSARSSRAVCLYFKTYQKYK